MKCYAAITKNQIECAEKFYCNHSECMSPDYQDGYKKGLEMLGVSLVPNNGKKMNGRPIMAVITHPTYLLGTYLETARDNYRGANDRSKSMLEQSRGGWGPKLSDESEKALEDAIELGNELIAKLDEFISTLEVADI